MRKTIGIFTLLVFVGFAYSGDDARSLVEKSIQAAGGETNLAKFNSMTWKEKGTYYGMGKGLPYTGTYAIAYPDKFRMEIEGVFTLALDGGKGWTQMMGETKEMTPEQFVAQQIDFRAGWISSLLPLKDKAYTLKTLADSKVGDVAVKVVQVTHKDYPEVKLYFDAKTNLLIKNEFRGKAAEMKFKDVTMELYFSDYRDVNGAKIAHKLEMKRDGDRFVEAEMSAIQSALKLDPKTFAKP